MRARLASNNSLMRITALNAAVAKSFYRQEESGKLPHAMPAHLLQRRVVFCPVLLYKQQQGEQRLALHVLFD